MTLRIEHTKKLQLDISKAMSICLKHGIKVYPVLNRVKKFVIEVDDNGSITTYEKEVTGSEINVAQSKTYKYYAERIINKKVNANSTKEN